MKTKLNKSTIQISGSIRFTEADGSFIDIDLNGNRLTQAKSGVYEIRNKFNGKRYIGMAKDLIARKNHHWFDLIRGIHKSKEMQADYDKYTVGGNDAKATDISPDNIFEFNVILYCYPSQLTFYENLLITYLQPEYNTHKKKAVKLEKKFDELGNNAQQKLIEEQADRFLNCCDDDCEEEMM